MFILKAIYAFFVDTIQTLILAASIFLVIYVFLLRPFQVSGESMIPTFQDREYILTNIITMRLESVQRGDVIVFKAPTDNNKDFIKRVIGLPGETVTIKNGSVYINDKKIDESRYLAPVVKTLPYGNYIEENESITARTGEYIVMGDNRSSSSDSREWGPLKKSEIIGKPFFVYWPFNKLRLIKNPF